MKKYGFLQTSSPVEETKKSNTPSPNPLENTKATSRKQNLSLPKDPLQNFQIVFMGPESSDIKEKLFGTSLMEHELWNLLFIRNEYGWRPLHFAILDYFCEKYNLALTVNHHEYRLIDESTLSERHFFQSILYGYWKDHVSDPKKYIPHSHKQPK